MKIFRSHHDDPPPRAKRRRCGSDQPPPVECAGVDLLSELPDGVLSHILSFSSLRDAYRAKLLSRRWRCIYPPNPTLTFKQLWESPVKYMARVDDFMQQFSAPKIECFEANLSCPHSDHDCVNEWIRLAILLKAEKIGLHGLSLYHKVYTFPFQILSTGKSSILKHLELCGCSLQPFSYLAGPLISLRTLKLDCVSLDESINFEDFSAYFPNLEYLSLALFKQLYNMQQLFDLCAQLYYLKSLVFRFVGRPIDIKIPKFTSDGSVMKRLNCLERLTICTHWSGQHLATFLSNLPKDAPQLITLSISYNTFSGFQFPEYITIFKCLKRLELPIRLSPQTDLQSLLKILPVAPALRELIVNVSGESTKYSTKWLEERLNPEHHPVRERHYLHSHLKTIKISSNCCFGKNHVEFIISVLQCGTSMKSCWLDCWAEENTIPELLRTLAQLYPAVKFVKE